jgi:hypothetical protein
MEKSRVAVVFDPVSGPSADDYKTFVESITRALTRNGEVLTLKSSGAAQTGRGGLAKGVRATLRAFQPDLVVHVPSPKPAFATVRSGLSVRRSARDANHVMVMLSPMQPSRLAKSRLAKALLHRLYPDPILVPSYRSLLGLSRLSLQGDVLPLGVDVKAFRPSSIDERNELRKRHGIDAAAFVFLLGTPLDEAGLDAARSLAEIDEAQMVAPAATADDALASEITSIGIRPLPVAEASPEIYRLADCFVFPSTNETDAVEFPMSILASLSCGVPVLSTPFGGLRDFLPEGDDLRYWNTTDELVQLAQGLINGPPVRVRAVEEFSWDEIAKRIVDR